MICQTTLVFTPLKQMLPLPLKEIVASLNSRNVINMFFFVFQSQYSKVLWKQDRRLLLRVELLASKRAS
jgi:hypothetical protein